MATSILETQTDIARKSSRGEPTWEVARFFPLQGEWTEDEYLAFSTEHFVELNDGCLEVLTPPNDLHQAIVGLLFRLLYEFVGSRKLGEVLFAPLPVRLWPGQFREPDIVFLDPDRLRKLREKGLKSQPDGAEMVVEVVSPGSESRHRDLVEKRDVYARAGIPEYWIVDPENRTITVLVLEGGAYRVHGAFESGDNATSVLVAGFAIAVSEVFAVLDATQ